MIIIRSLIFNIFFVIWTIFISIIFAPFAFFSPKKTTRIIGGWWSSGLLFALNIICNMKYEISGAENLPAKPFIIASRHESAWETIFFLKYFKDPAFVLKRELLKIPFYGPYLRRMGMIDIDRSGGMKSMKEMLDKVKKSIYDERIVVIFPEGTRINHGDEVKFHPGIAAIYSQIKAPIVPVGLDSGRFWKKNSFIKKPGIVRICFMPAIYPGVSKEEFMLSLKKSIYNS